MLASGSGTNLQALLDNAVIRSHISIVVSDRPGAGALERAERAGIATTVVPWSEFPDRDRFSMALGDVIEDSGAKGVVLAGFMRILSPGFVGRFSERILNVHPSLLPAFPGANAVAATLEHGAKVTGVTVHVVDEGVDSGPIVAQVPVEVLPGDTVESLHARIKAQEHLIYPRIVAAFVEGRLVVRGRDAEIR
ncbi:MAG TPA: phosphoribosylglycinamide formyltransferase [Acidimicrobiia bacterium]|nr:phosphoribosylglycinamide formyltransferase [Acidimicrobiia bacterium]